MQIFRTLAGYSLGRADIVRRAMSKKKHDVMQSEREVFIFGQKDENGNTIVKGAVNNGVTEAAAEKIFDEMSAFSSYAFNKSHAAAYSFVSYQTAYLKCHYPSEYMASLMTSMQEDTDKIAFYTNECSRLGIKILPPHINESFENFTPTKDGIRFGLLAIKNLGEGLVTSLIKNRIDGAYKSMYDFCERNAGKDFNRRALEGLIKSGAMDGLEVNRRTMLYGADAVLSAVGEQRKYYGSGQLDLFGDDGDDIGFELEAMEEMPMDVRLSMEKEATGLYLSGHPLEEYRGYAASQRAANISDILSEKYEDGEKVRVVVTLNSIKARTTKNDTMMANITAEDMTGTISITAFSRAYGDSRHILTPGAKLLVSGRVQEREDRPAELLADSFAAIPPTAANMPIPEKRVREGLYIRIKKAEDEELDRVKSILKTSFGDTPVIIVDEAGKRLMAPRELFITPTGELISKLEANFGKNNVKLVE